MFEMDQKYVRSLTFNVYIILYPNGEWESWDCQKYDHNIFAKAIKDFKQTVKHKPMACFI